MSIEIIDDKDILGSSYIAIKNKNKELAIHLNEVYKNEIRIAEYKNRYGKINYEDVEDLDYLKYFELTNDEIVEIAKYILEFYGQGNQIK